MKLTLQATLAAAVAALALGTPARAQTPAAPEEPARTAQADKRTECVHDKDAKAGTQKVECAEPRVAHEPQTHKMVRCNEEAGKKQLRGEERRAFMSTCLKG